MTKQVRRSGKPASDAKHSRTVLGYCWPWTARPGETVDFMVSSSTREPYKADLVRIICGDALSDAGLFKEQEKEAPFNGTYPARFQPTHIGSYVEIADNPALDSLDNFTVQAMVHPTLLPDGVRRRTGGIANSWGDAAFQDQHLISRWDNQKRQGWALLIDTEGRPSFMTGDGEHIQRITLEQSLSQDKWFLLVAGVDNRNRQIQLAVSSTAGAPGDFVAWPETRGVQPFPEHLSIPQSGPLRFAACADGPGNGARLKPAFCFNGRLDRVRLTSGMISMEEAGMLGAAAIPDDLKGRIIGFWDFGRDIDRIRVTDLSSNGLHGETVNAPARAVRGVGWDGSTDDWRQRPDHYSAIHFHDDDLYDAEWKKDFSFTIPEDLPSGIYAARLRQGASEDYMPFFVAPAKGRSHAPLAFLIPTASYTAYTNITGLTTLKRKRQIVDDRRQPKLIEEDTHTTILQDADDAAFLLENLRQLGKGLYSNHTDGTLAGCASQRHPNMTMKPKGINWQFAADTYISDWLEVKDIPFDVITDELLHAEGVNLLQHYTTVITGTHPEYHSRRMLDAIDQYQRQGGRWMYLGGNGFHWVTSFHKDLPGLIETRKNTYSGQWMQYELRNAFDGERGGLWEDNGRGPSLLAGVTYTQGGYAMESSAPYKRLPDSRLSRAAFIFEGVSNEIIGDYGLLGEGAAGQEVDAICAERGTPAHALHLARADDFPACGSIVAEEYKANTRGPIADMVFFETPNGGAVFSVGSISWAGALSHEEYSNDVSRITENVVRRFLDKSPFPIDDLKQSSSA